MSTSRTPASPEQFEEVRVTLVVLQAAVEVALEKVTKAQTDAARRPSRRPAGARGDRHGIHAV